jgi:hypothetical protein
VGYRTATNGTPGQQPVMAQCIHASWTAKKTIGRRRPVHPHVHAAVRLATVATPTNT